MFVKENEIVECVLEFENKVCVEKYEVLQKLGLFVLRKNDTVAFGKIIGIGKN